MRDNVVSFSDKLERRKFFDRVRTIICVILAFLLTIITVVFSIFCIVEWSCFHKSSLYSYLSSSNYYDSVQTEIYTKAEAITMPTGLSLDILQNIIDPEGIRKDIKGFIDAGFQNVSYQADTTSLKEKLRNNIKDYLAAEGIVPNEEQNKNIENFIQSIAGEYSKSIVVPLLNYLLSSRDHYSKVFIAGIADCFALIAIILFTVVKLNTKLKNSIKYITYSTLGSATMLILAPAVVLFTRFYQRIQLYPQYFYRFSMAFITNIIRLMIYFGIFYMLVSILMIAATQYKRRSVACKNEVN